MHSTIAALITREGGGAIRLRTINDELILYNSYTA